MKIITTAAAIYLLLFCEGCSSSTGSRYDKNIKETENITETTPDNEKKENETPAPDIFDITPYHTNFDFDLKAEVKNNDYIWYGYDSSSTEPEIKTYIDKAGYRVEVLATDDLNEANNMRAELRFKLRQNIYIIFDPPFYRVRTGDYEDRTSAENQSFKLKQLGYTECRVVSDSIKVNGIQ